LRYLCRTVAEIPVLNAVFWKLSYQGLCYFNFNLSFVICAGEGLHVLPSGCILYGHGGGGGGDKASSVIVSSGR
jgi:hypothetical protein